MLWRCACRTKRNQHSVCMQHALNMNAPSKHANYRLDPHVIQKAQLAKPSYLPLTAFLNLLLDQCLSGQNPIDTLGERSRATPLKAVNREEEERAGALPVEALRAEEAHLPLESAPKRKVNHDVAPELTEFEPLIRAYWKAKPKNKTAPAWKLLMTECKKILAAHGHDVLTTQLELAEAERWQGIKLTNYEKFGAPTKSQEPEPKHPAHQVFTAAEHYAKDEWAIPSVTGGRGVLEGTF